MHLWREHPLWEYCVNEEGIAGQDESTLKPSRAREWRSRFDHSAAYDLAMVFGEALLADGRAFPAELSFFAAPTVGRDAGPELLHIYFAPPSVEDRWTLVYERIVGRWVVPLVSKSIDEAAEHFQSCSPPEFDLSNIRIFPLTVRAFAPRFLGTSYELVIASDGESRGR